MSRSIRQLWDVREKFIKYERGWNEPLKNDNNSLHGDSELNSVESEQKDGAENAKEKDDNCGSSDGKEIDNEDVQKRLDAINRFYVRGIFFRIVRMLTFTSVTHCHTFNL